MRITASRIATLAAELNQLLTMQNSEKLIGVYNFGNEYSVVYTDVNGRDISMAFYSGTASQMYDYISAMIQGLKLAQNS